MYRRQVGLRTAEGSQTSSAFKTDQGFETGAYERCLFIDIGQPTCFFQQIIINIECRFHMY